LGVSRIMRVTKKIQANRKITTNPRTIGLETQTALKREDGDLVQDPRTERLGREERYTKLMNATSRKTQIGTENLLKN
jgi:hypothetical protein